MLIYLTNFKQQSRMHLMIAEQQAKGALFPVKAFIFFSTYSKRSLTNQVKATKKDPKDNDPKLYLIVHQNPVARLKLPSWSSWVVKYQLLTDTIITYLNIAERSSPIQNKAKSEQTMKIFYSPLSSKPFFCVPSVGFWISAVLTRSPKEMSQSPIHKKKMIPPIIGTKIILKC